MADTIENMPHPVCPHCEVVAPLFFRDDMTEYGILECQNCHKSYVVEQNFVYRYTTIKFGVSANADHDSLTSCDRPTTVVTADTPK